MYSNNIVNLQVYTTILNACKKKSGNLSYIYIYIYIRIYPTPWLRAGCRRRSVFYNGGQVILNSKVEFSFFYTGYNRKTKRSYLIAAGRKDGFIPFPRALMLSENPKRVYVCVCVWLTNRSFKLDKQ